MKRLRSGDRRKLEMPLVQMTLMEGRPKEQLHAIMAAVTAAVAGGRNGLRPKKIRAKCPVTLTPTDGALAACRQA